MIDFKGNWIINVELPLFSHLCIFEQRSPKEKISLTFGDQLFLSIEPDPLPEQLTTANFILNNEKLILESLFEHIKDIVFPFLKTLIDDEEYCFPPLHTSDDLQKVLGIYDITIPELHKDGFAYALLNFNFSADNEHGISFLIHKNRIVEYNEIGSIDYDKIYEELGINGREFEENWNNLSREIRHEFYTPHLKYNKLKPWQLDSNQSYLSNLLGNHKNEEIIKLIDSINLTPNQNLDNYFELNLIEVATQCKNIEMIHYFRSKGCDLKNMILFCKRQDDNNQRIFDFKFLDLAIELGANLNTSIVSYHKGTWLFDEIYNIVQLFFHRKENKEIEIQKHQKNIQELLKRGANLDDCDGKETHYLKMLETRYAVHFIEKTGIKELVESC